MARPVTLIVLFSVAALSVGGCPTSDGPGAAPEVTASAPESAEAGAVVTLTASVSRDDVSYQWYQSFGRAVSLSDETSAAPTFKVPSMGTDQVARFRVVVETPAGQKASAGVAVKFQKDPDYDSGDTPAADDSDPRPQVRLTTGLGDIVVELDRERAPITVNNFLRYVDQGLYNGTIFHRVVEDFVVQGGGFKPGLEPIDTFGDIRNEAGNGLSNVRGTIAMARQQDPDSANAQFYFNLVDNDSLDPTEDSAGYAVFGHIVDGIDVVDEIATVETETREGFQDVPVDDVTLETAERVQTEE